MNLSDILAERRTTILADALAALERAHLPHYQASPPAENTARLTALLDLVTQCVAATSLVPMHTYAQELARTRFASGFDLGEVLTAMNVLEEALWHHLTVAVPPSDYPQALGLISTVLGAGKQALATEYVSLASRTHVQSLDLTRLFAGTN